MRRQNSILKFIEIVEEIPLDKYGCKIWPMGINSQGYGNYSIHNRTYSVHRLIFTTLNKRSYYGLVVRHKCDNRACCNIDHLDIGTQSENIMDASKRNRLKVGRENNMTKLTEEQVLRIRNEYPRKSTVELGKEFRVSPGNIRDAINGKNWKHLPGAKKLIKFNRALGEKMGRSKLTDLQVLEIRGKYPSIKAPKLAEEYGVGHAMIYNIVKRKNWTHI